MEPINEKCDNQAIDSMPQLVCSAPGNPTVTNNPPPATKIELFRSLFQGRENVYARRFKCIANSQNVSRRNRSRLEARVKVFGRPVRSGIRE
jgi:hypothetical protein